jgi:hypothetical protein
MGCGDSVGSFNDDGLSRRQSVRPRFSGRRVRGGPTSRLPRPAARSRQFSSLTATGYPIFSVKVTAWAAASRSFISAKSRLCRQDLRFGEIAVSIFHRSLRLTDACFNGLLSDLSQDPAFLKG